MYLQNTCKIRKIKQTVDITGVTYYLPIIQPLRHTGWHGETFISKTTKEPQAVLYWRIKADEDEEREVQWFIAQDGAFYCTNHVKHPFPAGEPKE